MTILASFKCKVDKKPGCAATEITFMLCKSKKSWLNFRPYYIQTMFEDYTNLFEMSNGMPGEIGTIFQTVKRFRKFEDALEEWESRKTLAKLAGQLVSEYEHIHLDT